MALTADTADYCVPCRVVPFDRSACFLFLLLLLLLLLLLCLHFWVATDDNAGDDDQFLVSLRKGTEKEKEKDYEGSDGRYCCYYY